MDRRDPGDGPGSDRSGTETLAKTAQLRGPLAGRASLERYGGALILDSGKLILVGDLAIVSNHADSDRRSA